ncbi:hypothetical protein NQ318_001681 [Aromia moschata]|uniref:Mos1 transposase HTH domain-containing protein n=1 Tax=Aromia moschata TaxID=1265417 RepID=A0AAV8X644_9CUCU|nr:hypothetical protein NQ318_001681 [Aromia moschata]
MLNVQLEQRVNLKFLVKEGKTFREAYAMLKEVSGNKCLSHTQVFEWFKRFKEGHETTEDDSRPGRPSTSKTGEKIEKIDVFPLKNVILSIEPRIVQRGNQSRLRCSYDLEGQDLYTVNSSNSTQAVLRNIEFNLSGNFSCEVTTDKTFSTGVDSQEMVVVVINTND